jgi:hypothetical protein
MYSEILDFAKVSEFARLELTRVTDTAEIFGYASVRGGLIRNNREVSGYEDLRGYGLEDSFPFNFEPYDE